MKHIVFISRAALAAASLLLLGPACSGDNNNAVPDGGAQPDADSLVDMCKDDTPCTLTAGTMSTDYVAPAGDTDRWLIDVPSAGSVMQVVVSNDADFSPIRLEVALFDPSNTALTTRSFNGNGKQRIDIQIVAPAAGQYALVVRDAGNDGADRRNPYFIVVSLLPETDNNEPNDTSDMPTLLTPGTPVSGTIGFQGDEDWFAVDIPASQILEISMTFGSAPVPEGVLIKYVLFDPTGVTAIAESTEAGGGATALRENRSVGAAAGRYLIQVQDDDRMQADLMRTYVLTVSLIAEPDANDLAAPNDTYATPTSAMPGQTITGYIASKGDEDWYDIRVRNAPALITVEATMDPASPVDIAFDIVEADGTTQICADEPSCRSLRFSPETSANRPATIKTSQIARTATRYLVVVRDFQDNEYDVARSYTLRIDTPAEPDPNETYDDSRMNARVVQAATATTGTTITWPWISGYLSYADDIDWYALPFPGPMGAAPGQNGDWLIRIEVQTNPTPIELQLFMSANGRDYGGYGKQCRMPPQGDPDPTQLACQFPDAQNAEDTVYDEGTGECIVVFRELTGAGPHYFRITDLNRDDFDLVQPYRFRVTLTAGCGPQSLCVGRYLDNGQDLCLRP